jgi:hypothetical protein
MQVRDVLGLMEIGKSVAEQDSELDKYFIETEAFRALIADKVDVVAGDKGTGKSAIFRMLEKNYRQYKELSEIELLSAFNPTGSPVFQRLAADQVYSEGVYRTIWKAYFLSLVGNWILDVFDETYNVELNNLSAMLTALDLRSKSFDAASIFSRIADFFSGKNTVKKVAIDFSVTETGMPIVSPSVEFSGKAEGQTAIYCDDFLNALEAALVACDVKVWLAMDRLDEAFVGFPLVETPALRALLRTYLDFSSLKMLKLKLFLRRDLFRRVTAGGFVNLSHINAMRIDIEWQDDDLIAMLEKRITNSPKFMETLGLEDAETGTIFKRIFPDQIDVGDRKPSAQNWIMSRIQDGKGVRPPRNLIDLTIKSRENQLRREQRDSRGDYVEGTVLFEADSVRAGHKQLSQIRVDDTLLAEAGVLADYIQMFKDEKSEHNLATIAGVLELPAEDALSVTRALVEMGFLEELKGTYKIPMLYREGLNIVQGKAF